MQSCFRWRRRRVKDGRLSAESGCACNQHTSESPKRKAVKNAATRARKCSASSRDVTQRWPTQGPTVLRMALAPVPGGPPRAVWRQMMSLLSFPSSRHHPLLHPRLCGHRTTRRQVCFRLIQPIVGANTDKVTTSTVATFCSALARRNSTG